MHISALQRLRTNQRHLDDRSPKRRGCIAPGPHLGTRLYLKGPDGITSAQIVVYRFIIERQRIDIGRRGSLLDNVQTLVDGRKGTQ